MKKYSKILIVSVIMIMLLGVICLAACNDDTPDTPSPDAGGNKPAEKPDSPIKTFADMIEYKSATAYDLVLKGANVSPNAENVHVNIKGDGEKIESATVRQIEIGENTVTINTASMKPGAEFYVAKFLVGKQNIGSSIFTSPLTVAKDKIGNDALASSIASFKNIDVTGQFLSLVNIKATTEKEGYASKVVVQIHLPNGVQKIDFYSKFVTSEEIIANMNDENVVVTKCEYKDLGTELKATSVDKEFPNA